MDNQQQDKQKILDAVADYYRKYHINKPYNDGDRISYAARMYDEKEMTKLTDSALEFWLTSGRYTDQFEKDLANYLELRFCSLVNSGSSANLLAFMALTSPMLKERRIERGDEVITVAAGFPTTVAPIVQYGAVPVFVDLTIPDYNIDTQMLDKALSPKTKAVMIAHTLGMPFDLDEVKSFCDKNNLWLIEDNCDALGSRYLYKGEWRYTGTVGDIGTSSFYPPHHMTMGEGGAVYTNNPLLNRIMRSMRDWGRDCICPSGKDNLCGNRFNGQYGLLPFGYDHKYVYSHFGYNLKATDLQAAIGVAQLEKFPSFVIKRKENFAKLNERLQVVKDKILLPKISDKSDPSYFGYLITVGEGLSRDKIVVKLEKNNIQTRALFAGNLIKHPCFDFMREDSTSYRVVGELNNTDRIMNDSFWIGVYPGMTDDMLNKMADVIIEAVNEN